MSKKPSRTVASSVTSENSLKEPFFLLSWSFWAASLPLDFFGFFAANAVPEGASSASATKRTMKRFTADDLLSIGEECAGDAVANRDVASRQARSSYYKGAPAGDGHPP